MPDYNRPDAFRFSFAGMDTVHPPDAMPQGKYPLAINVRAYFKDRISPRLGQSAALVTLIPANVVHSLRRLNDTTPAGPAAGYGFVSGAGTGLYVGGTKVDDGYSGKRMSMVSYRPNASVQPWMYVADSNRGTKVLATGTLKPTGIPEPQVPAFALVGPLTKNFAVISGFEDPTAWGGFGTGSGVPGGGAVTNLRPTSAVQGGPVGGVNSFTSTGNAFDGNTLSASLGTDRVLDADAGTEETWLGFPAAVGVVTAITLNVMSGFTSVAGCVGDAEINYSLDNGVSWNPLSFGTGSYAKRTDSVSLAIGQDMTKVKVAAFVIASTGPPTAGAKALLSVYEIWASVTTSGGGAGLTTGNRVTVNPTANVYDYQLESGGGESSFVVPSVANIALNQILYNGGPPNGLPHLVEAIPVQPTNSTIGSILYDSPFTGYASIYPTTFPLTCAVGSVYRLDSGGPNDEYVSVISITTVSGVAPGTLLRVKTTKVHAAAETMTGQLSIKTNGPYELFLVGVNTLQDNYVIQVINSGIGGIISTPGAGAVDFTMQNRKPQASDAIHFQVNVDDKTRITNCVITFNLDPNRLDFASNAFTWTIAGAAFANGWNDLSVLVSALVRVGTNTELDLTTGVTAIQIAFTVTNTINVLYGTLDVLGDYGPSVTAQEVGVFYRYTGRDSTTGARSNPSPPMRASVFPVAPGQSVIVTFPFLNDGVSDKLDIYRFGGGLLDYTYVGTTGNTNINGVSWVDMLDDPTVANNPLLEFDNFEPFPSIDLPRSGTASVAGFTLNRLSGDTFNTRWAPGTIITVNGIPRTLYNRPQSTTSLTTLEDLGTSGFVTWSIAAPTLLTQRLPTLWGPTDNAGFFFAVGDPLRQGTLYFTKGNNPDSAPDTNQIEVTSPSEPLVNGVIVDGLGMVFSTERAWLIYPNFAQATASILGVIGNPFTVIESISERGLYAKEGICTNGGGIVYFIAKDGIRMSPGGAGSKSITDDDLYNLFPHEGQTQPTPSYTLAGTTISAPDFTKPDGLALRFAQGYLYFDYIGFDGQRHTLVYDTSSEGWIVDVYATVASIHADNEGEGGMAGVISPGQGIGVLMGCTDGTIRDLDNTSGLEVTNMTLATPAVGAGRETNHFGDLYVEARGVLATPWTLALWTDRYTVNSSFTLSPASLSSAAFGRTFYVIDLNAGQGVYARDLGMVFSTPVNAARAELYLWQPSLVPQPETIQERYTDWHDGGTVGAKFIQGAIIEADTVSVLKQVQAQSGDDLSLHAFAEAFRFSGRAKQAFSFAVPFVAHTVRLAPQDQIAWRLWDVEWVFVPYPELTKEWHTEGVAHGLKGFQHIGEINVAHVSSADMTLTLTPDVGAPQSVVIPNSAGLQAKTLVVVPAFKFKLVSYNFTSTQPFRLWVEDVEVKIKSWGDTGPYQIIKPFGGSSAMKAEV